MTVFIVQDGKNGEMTTLPKDRNGPAVFNVYCVYSACWNIEIGIWAQNALQTQENPARQERNAPSEGKKEGETGWEN